MKMGAGLALLLVLAACGGKMDQFDRAAWSKGAGDYGGANPRIAMVEAARGAGVKPGASRADVRALLGEPDSSGPEADIWYLGRDTMSVDFRTLRVDYGADGRATAVEERKG